VQPVVFCAFTCVRLTYELVRALRCSLILTRLMIPHQPGKPQYTARGSETGHTISHTRCACAPPRRPKPFWWPSNSNSEAVAAASAEFVVGTLNSTVGALMAVNKVAWADLRG
jgi:hypothetical protein